MKSRYSIPTTNCCYCYISKNLKKEITKHQKELQKQENNKFGKKSQRVTFSFASKNFIKEVLK